MVNDVISYRVPRALTSVSRNRIIQDAYAEVRTGRRKVIIPLPSDRVALLLTLVLCV